MAGSKKKAARKAEGRKADRAARDDARRIAPSLRGLQNELDRLEQDLEIARQKRDRAQARVDALDVIAAQLVVAIEAAERSHVAETDDPSSVSGTGAALKPETTPTS